MLPPDFDEFRTNARRALLAARGPHGHWDGQLSNSALSTATALFTLSLHDRATGKPAHAASIAGGLRWLADTQNADGGWGDTPLSLSNLSTTALCWAALAVPEAARLGDLTAHAAARAAVYTLTTGGSLEPRPLAKAIAARYGKDRTFSIPILTMLALAGRLGPNGWRFVPQLPFELAACPHHWFQWLRLPVVSYALPALIAIGHVRHHHRPTWNPLTRLARRLTHARTLRKLRDIQPTTGGFLEATPLTSFVAMSLIASEQVNHPVVVEGVKFLERSVRPDGSWPIDTNLATWVTTLSVNALGDIPDAEREVIRDWLLNQQYRSEHPYTHAAPGGWAWTDLAGGVPDADDTPGALLALAKLGPPDERTLDAAAAGVRWLLDLQNGDGGIPTFCRGWTGLPFDRSSADLTAHTLLAWAAWRDRLSATLRTETNTAARRAINYLMRTQGPDGAWAPLWFGNQYSDDVANLTYGTSRVLRLAKILDSFATEPNWRNCLERGIEWMLANQNSDGGWGGRTGTPSSIEETALALEALGATRHFSPADCSLAVRRGFDWLIARSDRGTTFPCAPIGFYFANLWYFETLYPLIFTVAAIHNSGDAVCPST